MKNSAPPQLLLSTTSSNSTLPEVADIIRLIAMKLSNSTLCYEAVQRVYRPAVVAHLRKTLKGQFPDRWKKELVNTVGEDVWKLNEENVRARQTSGEIRSKITDDFDLLDLSHFYNLFDKHFSLVFPCKTGESDKERARRKKAILDWTQTVKTLRDPLSHPNEQDFTFQDAFRMIDCAFRVLEALELPDSIQLKNIIDDLAGERTGETGAPTDPLQSSLPAYESVVVDFIGRNDERKILWDWLQNPQARRWALAGEGGKGKSAIAYQFASEVRVGTPNRVEAVWWLSAKKKKYVDGNVVKISDPEFDGLSSACDKLLLNYGRNDFLDWSLEERKSRVLQLLNEVPSLVVVDDLDSLEGEDEAAIEFFTLAAPATKSKILLTTRRTVFGMAHTTTHISGMKPEDFTKFLQSRAKIFGLDSNVLTESRINEIAHLTEMSPLYAEDLLRLAAIVSLHEAVRGWHGKFGDEARQYALKRELDILSSNAREALLCACLSSGPMSFSELEALTGFPKQRLRTAIAEMQRLFLVPKPRLIEGEERFDVNLNTRALVVKALEGTDAFRRAKAAVASIGGRQPYTARGKTGAVIREVVFLVRTNELIRAEETIRAALHSEPNNADLVGALGYVYKYWKPKRRSTDARQYFARAAQLKCRKVDPYRHWINLEIDEKEWTNAIHAAEEGAKNIPHCAEFLYWAGHAHYRLGKELSSGLLAERARTELESAAELLQRALRPPEHLQTAEERRLNSVSYRSLTLAYDALIEIADLEKLRGLPKVAPDWGRAEYVRKLKQTLAEWYSEHPDDQFVESDITRFERKFDLRIG